MKIKKLMICVVAFLSISSAYADSHVEVGTGKGGTTADQSFPTEINGILVIPGAYSEDKDGRPLTAQSRQADATGGATIPDGLVAKPLPTAKQSLQQGPDNPGMRALEAEHNAVPAFVGAMKASFGGYTRDLFRIAAQKQGAKDVDPKYDRGAGRRKFRENYGTEYWDEYERTVNQSQQDELIARLDEKAKRKAAQRNSLAGTLVGSLFDPVALLGLMMVVFLLRRLALIIFEEFDLRRATTELVARFTTSSVQNKFWRSSPSTRFVALAVVLWMIAVSMYVYLFEPYGYTMYSEECAHLLKVMLFPSVFLVLSYFAYVKLVRDKPSP